MLHVDDAGLVSRFPERLTRTMAIAVEAFEAFGLAESEKKTESLRMEGPGVTVNARVLSGGREFHFLLAQGGRQGQSADVRLNGTAKGPCNRVCGVGKKAKKYPV